MNRTFLAQTLAWLLAALAMALDLAGLAISWRSDQSLATHILFGPVTALAYALIGALIAARQSRNPIGWMFLAVALCFALTLFASSYGDSILPGYAIARWLNLWIWMPATILPLSFVLLLFPHGRLLSPRWRVVAWSSGLGLAAFIVSTALHPRPPIEPVPPFNPFGIQGIETVLTALYTLASGLLVVGCIGSLAALMVRFRRSHTIEREQIKWLLYGSGVAIISMIGTSIWAAVRPGDLVAYELSLISVSLGLALVVIAAGIAILRHGLYNINLIINRTLVYAVLSACVVALYVLLVGAFSALFQSSGNLPVALLATGLVAILFQPLRLRLQRSVNRLMYGERDDPYAVLSGLSQQLKTTLVPSAVLPTITQVVAQTLKLPYVGLAVMHGNRLEIAAAYGQPTTVAVQLPLIYQAETVGQLVVAPRRPGEAFTPAERRLLEDIAGQTGIAAHAVRLTADLQRSRERLVMAREEERRRLRRDLHDGLGPQLASMTLTVAAAREVLRHNPETADILLRELAAHTQTAIADIRRVVYDLRPPALDDLGLVLALREQATHYSQGGLQIMIVSEPMPPLPAAVEVAAYRIVQESLTNVVRHAHASTCTVRLSTTSALELEISDNGVGVPNDVRSGVGLMSMRERTAELGGTWSIDAMPIGGTRIRVELPLRQETV